DIMIWDATTGRLVRTLQGYGHNRLAFSPDGTRLASASFDGSIRVWDGNTGKELCKIIGHTTSTGHWGRVSRLAFTPDGTRLVSAGHQDAGEDRAGRLWDTTVKIWDVKSGQELRTIKGDTSAVAGLGAAIIPEKSRLALSQNDNTIKIWDLNSG